MKIHILSISMILCYCLGLVNPGWAQSASFGNVYLGAGIELSIHDGTHYLLKNKTGSLPGIIGTERTSTNGVGVLSFMGTASHVQASDTTHVDGYVRSYLSSAFVFPIGDNGKYRPIAITSASTTQPVDAAYFGVNPSSAVTSSIKGGNEPVLPSTGPFSISAHGSGLSAVSNVEYWEINGEGTTKITLTWNTNSGINTLLGADLNRLTIVGWDGTQWVSIASTVDATALLGGSSTLSAGSITTSSSVVPNAYHIYSLAALETSNKVTLNVKVFLQGAYSSATGLMTDALRANNYLPLTDPYTSSGNTRFTHVGSGTAATTTQAVLDNNAGTANAIVDWIFIELRSVADNTNVLETRAALVQRDGDVVDPFDGISPLVFFELSGQQFFVAVKHRNHLGAMTATSHTLTEAGTLVDFTSMDYADLYHRNGYSDGTEMVTIGGVKALWAGDANRDGTLKYQSAPSDFNEILNQLLGFPGNTTDLHNYGAAFGYFSGDINMDGKLVYQGQHTDGFQLFGNFYSYPLNTNKLYNYALFVEQLPISTID